MVPIFIPMIIPFKVGAGAAATMTAGHAAVLLAAGTVGAAAGIVVAEKVMRDPVLYDKTGKAVRFAMGSLYTPVLLAEDIARKCGADIPKEGFLHNSEGKSIWEIWNESQPLSREEQELVRQFA